MDPVREDASGKVIRTAIVAQATLMDCQLLAAAVERQCRLHIVACLINSSEIESAVREKNPDLVLISARMQDGHYAGLKAAKKLQLLNPTTKIVMLLDSEDRDLVVESFRCGAQGIFTRNESTRQLCKCITAVLQDQIWASNTQIKYVVEALVQTNAPILVDSSNLRSLTKREYEVVRLLAAGFSNREIGDRLKLHENTVKNYVSEIFHKLGVSTRIELVLHFFSARPQRPEREEGESTARKFGT